jgi:hypothetical protein
MGLTSQVIRLVDDNEIVLKAIADMCAQCEPARELVVMKLKEVNLQKLIKSKYANDVLLSLSRSSKILNQIICEE